MSVSKIRSVRVVQGRLLNDIINLPKASIFEFANKPLTSSTTVIIVFTLQLQVVGC